jgi:hypothetical protein
MEQDSTAQDHRTPQDRITERITGQNQRTGSHAGIKEKRTAFYGITRGKVELDHAERGKDKK